MKKHYDDCPGSYGCCCSIIEERNKYRAALRKILRLRLRWKSTCFPYPDAAASLVLVASDALHGKVDLE